MTDLLMAEVAAFHRRYPSGERATASGWILAADVPERQVSWLWRGRLPFGALAVLAGDGGLGKSLVAAEIAARVTCGQTLPGGPESDAADVVILSAEDDPSTVLVPRLRLAGADLGRVHLWHDADGGDLTIPERLAELSSRVQGVSARLLVVDPGPAFMSPGTNPNGERDIRGFLRPLRALAEASGAAVLVLAHLRKGEGTAGHRVLGGVAWRNAPRLVLVMGRHPDADGDTADPRRVIAVEKSNYAAFPPAVVLTITPCGGEEHPSVRWDGEATISADDLVARVVSPENRSEQEDAAGFLRGCLADGPRGASEVLAEGASAGLAERTIRRAKRRLQVVSTRFGGPGAAGRWEWSLPAGSEAPSKAAIASAAFGDGTLGSLSENAHGHWDDGDAALLTLPTSERGSLSVGSAPGNAEKARGSALAAERCASAVATTPGGDR